MQGFIQWRRWLERAFPKGHDFALLLKEQAASVAASVELVRDHLDHRPQAQGVPTAEDVARSFEQARLEKQRCLEALNDSFATEFDREDIFRAIEDLNWIAEYAARGVEELHALALVSDDATGRLAVTVARGARALSDAYAALGTDKRAALALAHEGEICDGQARAEYVTALGALLVPGVDPLEAMKRREVYHHLADAATRVRRASMVLANMIVKDPA